jgi:hypothetical protein
MHTLRFWTQQRGLISASIILYGFPKQSTCRVVDEVMLVYSRSFSMATPRQEQINSYLY